jgi:N-acetylglutamate synthase-like GNAT family acetyltransferase
MEIKYQVGVLPAPEQIISVYENAGLARPADPARIRKMYENSDIVVTAWHEELLVGVSRVVTDFSWCCYLPDLAIDNNYQKKGIGAALIELIKKQIGKQCMFVLLSVPEAMDYYPRLGFTKQEGCFIIKRTE